MSDAFRAGAVEVHPLDGERRLLVGLRSGRTLEGTDADAALLMSCQQFRTIEQHAADISRRQELEGARSFAAKRSRWLQTVVQHTERSLPPDSRRVEPIAQRLRQFAEAGLLVSRDSFIREAGAGAGAAPPAIRTVGFTTRNRPALLVRSIESWRQNAEEYGRSLKITVIDDARTAEEERSTAEALAGLAEHAVTIRLAGPSQRDAYAEALAKEAAVDLELVRFALRGDERCPISTGSARNSLLLDSAGEPYVLADDDGMAKLAACPEPLPGLGVSSRNDPTDFWFFRNRDELYDGVEFVSRDVLGEHERLLGRSTAELIAAAADETELDLTMMAVGLEGRLRDGDVRVRTSMAGVVGDSGIGGTAHLFTSPQSQRRLTVSEEFFNDAIGNRQSLRLPRRLTVGDGVITMAGNLGLDATELLPPFCPVQRNSDGLLGRTLNQCFPKGCKGYLDVAALHDPPPGRSQSLDKWWDQLRRVRFSDIVAALLEEQSPDHSRPSAPDALRQLGTRLITIAALPEPHFRGRLRGLLLRRESARLNRDRSNEPGEMPAFYAALRLRQVKTIREALQTDRYLEPRDLPVDKPLALAQETVGRFGELLAAWPTIWAAAIRLRASGRWLAQPVGKA